LDSDDSEDEENEEAQHQDVTEHRQSVEQQRHQYTHTYVRATVVKIHNEYSKACSKGQLDLQ